MKIVITHAYTHKNQGDNLILSEMVKYLENLPGKISITLLSVFNETDSRYTEEAFTGEFQDSLCNRVPALWGAIPMHYSNVRSAVSFLKGLTQTTIVLLMVKIGRHALCFAPKGRMKSAIEAMLNADVMVVKGGGIFIGDPGLKSRLRLWKKLYPIALAGLLRVPVVLFPQTIGPFASKVDVILTRWVLNPTALIMVRERKSLNTLRNIRITKPQIFVVPDMGFGVGKVNIEVPDVSSSIDSSSHKARIGITIRPWSFPGRKESSVLYNQYVVAVEKAAVELAKRFSAKFLIIQQVFGPGLEEDDRPVSELLFKRLRANGVDVQILPVRTSLEEHIVLYKALSVLIATRMHSAISAMRWGVPVVMISYSPNRDYGIMEMMDLGEYVFPIDSVSATDIYQSVAGLLSNRNISFKILKNYRNIQENLSKKLKYLENFLATFSQR